MRILTISNTFTHIIQQMRSLCEEIAKKYAAKFQSLGSMIEFIIIFATFCIDFKIYLMLKKISFIIPKKRRKNTLKMKI